MAGCRASAETGLERNEKGEGQPELAPIPFPMSESRLTRYDPVAASFRQPIDGFRPHGLVGREAFKSARVKGKSTLSGLRTPPAETVLVGSSVFAMLHSRSSNTRMRSSYPPTATMLPPGFHSTQRTPRPGSSHLSLRRGMSPAAKATDGGEGIIRRGFCVGGR